MRFSENDVFPLDNSPGYLLNLAVREISVHLARAFKAGGLELTPQQWSLLARLWEKDGQHQNELAETTTKDRHNVARILALMERNGMIERRPDRDDKRLQRVYLTDLGKCLRPRLTAMALEVLEQAFQGVSDKDVQRFREICRRVIANSSVHSSPKGE